MSREPTSLDPKPSVNSATRLGAAVADIAQTLEFKRFRAIPGA